MIEPVTPIPEFSGTDYSSLVHTEIDSLSMETESAIDSLMNLSAENQQDSGSYLTSTPLPQRKRKSVTFAEEETPTSTDYSRLREDLEQMTATYDSLKQAMSGMVSAADYAKVVEERDMLQASLSSLKESFNNAVRARNCNNHCPAQDMAIAKLEEVFKTHTLVSKGSLEQVVKTLKGVDDTKEIFADARLSLAQLQEELAMLF